MLRSHPTQVFVLKYWAPIVLFSCTFVFWNTQFHWAQLIILIPVVVGGLFHASLAILQVPDGNIRYRRFFKWRRLRFDEIVSCGVLRSTGIGYIRLNQFLWPWGRLYFVLDPNEKLFSQGQHPLLQFIQGRIEPKAN
jgi:hypothetical protein